MSVGTGIDDYLVGFLDSAELNGAGALGEAALGLVSEFLVVSDPHRAMLLVGEGFEELRIELNWRHDNNLTSKTVDCHARLNEEIDRGRVSGHGLFDQQQPGDDAPGMMTDVVAPSHIAKVGLLVFQVGRAKVLALVIVEPEDFVGCHASSPISSSVERCSFSMRRVRRGSIPLECEARRRPEGWRTAGPAPPPESGHRTDRARHSRPPSQTV